MQTHGAQVQVPSLNSIIREPVHHPTDTLLGTQKKIDTIRQ